MPVRSRWFIVLFKSYTSLLIFCPVVLFIIENGILKCPTITVELFMSPFSSDSYCFMYFKTVVGFLHFYCLLLKCEKVKCLILFLYNPKQITITYSRVSKVFLFKYLGFESYMVSVVATQLCCCSTKAVIDNT